MRVWLIIFVAFCALYWLLPQKYEKWLYLATVIALSAMAFNCVPKVTDDLHGYYMQLEGLRHTGWQHFQLMLDSNVNNWGSLPVCGYYFYFVSKLGKNGFLPAITIFLAYGSIFLILHRVSERFKVEKWYSFLGCAFVFVTYWFYDICSGVRNGLAFTIFSICVYYDVVEKRHRWLCYIGYFLCFGLHSSMIIMIMMRFALFLADKLSGKWVTWAMLIAIPVGSSALMWLGEVTNNRYLSLLAAKAEHNAEITFSLRATYVWVNTAVLAVVILLSIYLFVFVRQSERYGEIESFMTFYIMLLCFTVGSFSSQLVYIRIIRWMIPIFGSVFVMIGMQACHNVQSKALEKQSRHSVIRTRENTLASNELLLTILLVGFTAVHLWYTCKGSSLIWLHFR